MIVGSEWLLIGAVATVGVLHTLVPDHWVPITLIARQQGWSGREVARAALVAGTGHTVSTLLIGLVVWIAGVAFATKFGNLVSLVSSFALIAFGAWIALSSLRELRNEHEHGRGHGHVRGTTSRSHARKRAPIGTDRAILEGAMLEPHDHEHGDDADQADALFVPSSLGAAVLTKHIHAHRHGRSSIHVHLHDHGPDTWHRESTDPAAEPPAHEHRHKRSLRMTLVLILGSSPMVEGIPAFFAAAKYGPALIAMMAVVFALSTIATYIGLCVSSVAGLERVKLGPLERYGEVLSGAFICAVGLIFLIYPIV